MKTAGNAAPWLIGTLLAILALALRLHGLGDESLFMDELQQVRAYGMDSRAVFAVALSQAQPPLDYLLGSGMVAAFGDTDLTVRLPAALFGAASVALLFALALNWTGLAAATLAALALALSPFHVYYSQEARPYALPACMLLLVWLLLARIMRAAQPPRALFLALGGAALLCLYSSALYPLVTLSVLASGLGLAWAASGVPGPRDSRMGRAALVLALAVLAYLPMFGYIVHAGARYAPRAAAAPSELLHAGLQRLEWRPLWEALLVQGEPFAGALLAGCALALLAPAPGGRAGARRVAGFVAAVLAASAALHLLVFVAASDLPFRPPYPGYLLPGLLLLAALGADGVLRAPRRPIVRATLAGVSVATLLLAGVPRLLDFKTTAKRADWRGVARLCADRFDARHLLVFATLGGSSTWKPTFFGFPRYYHGNTPQAELDWMTRHPDEWRTSTLIPVLVIFGYDDYLLTSRSAYPVVRGLPGYQPDPALDSDPLLRVDRLRGFRVVGLARPEAGLRDNLARLVARVRERLPPGTARAEWDAMAGVLAGDAATTAPRKDQEP